MVFEVAIGADLLDDFEPHLMDFGLGVMKNVTPDWAVGMVAGIDLFVRRSDTEQDLHVRGWSLKPRARRWVTGDIGIDMEAGLLHRYEWSAGTLHDDPEGSGWGMTLGGRINWNDRGLLHLRYDLAWLRALAPQEQPEGTEPLPLRQRYVRHALITGTGAGSDVALAALFPAIVASFMYTCPRVYSPGC